MLRIDLEKNFSSLRLRRLLVTEEQRSGANPTPGDSYLITQLEL